jgi:hypothetical protein
MSLPLRRRSDCVPAVKYQTADLHQSGGSTGGVSTRKPSWDTKASHPRAEFIVRDRLSPVGLVAMSGTFQQDLGVEEMFGLEPV